MEWLQHVCDNPPSGCAEWPFHIGRLGYGKAFYKGVRQSASRVALILFSGEDHKGLDAAHGPCHNRACCNPLHLSWKTRAENIADRWRDGTGQDDRKGEDSPVAKLTNSDVLEIRRLYSETEALQKHIARRFGITQMHVSSIVNRKSWKHLDNEVTT